MFTIEKKADLSKPILQAEGVMFIYSQQQTIAYRSNIKSKKYLVFIDGMFGNILSIPYFQTLKHYCDSHNIVFVYPQLRSHPHYKLHPIEDDVQDITSLIKILDGQIVLMGSSTGCQDSLLYAQSGKSQKVKGIILQAPVSDVQSNYMFDPNLKQSVVKAKETTQKFFTYADNTWLTQRFITVHDQRNKQDLFSSYLQDNLFEQWKPYGPILSVLSKKDQYAQKDLSVKFKLMGDVVIIQQGDHQITKSEAQKDLINAVDAFLKKINFI